MSNFWAILKLFFKRFMGKYNIALAAVMLPQVMLLLAALRGLGAHLPYTVWTVLSLWYVVLFAIFTLGLVLAGSRGD